MLKKKTVIISEGMSDNIIRAFASAVTQKDWFALAEKAVKLALVGKPELLKTFLPIIARKMPEEIRTTQTQEAALPPAEILAMKSESMPRNHANA